MESWDTGSQIADDMNEELYEPSALNLGITGALGATFNFGLEISLGYTHGLTNLYDQKKTLAGDWPEWSYSRLNFNIGYWFGYR